MPSPSSLHARARWASLSLLLALAACGGGSGSSTPEPTPAPPPGPVPAPSPAPAPAPTPSGSDRIEPYDPGATQAVQATKQGAQAAAAAQDARTVALGPLAATSVKAAALVDPGTPLQIGQARSVGDTATPEAAARLLRWQPGARGTQVAALRFVAEGAHGVRLGVLVQALPEGAVLRAYGTPQGDVVQISARQLQELAARNAQGGADETVARTWWSPDFGGAQTTLEIEVASAADIAAVRLSVPRLSHFTQAPQQAEEALLPKAAGSCNVDVACRPEYLEQSRSVARMLFVREDGQTYLCTGTLMNDASSSGTPYFLSANHCVGTQAVASTLTTDWFLRAPGCGAAGTTPAATRVAGGATLLYAAARTDTAFMRLNNPPPAGIVYAGSYFGTPLQPGTALADVHHPAGDPQKISLGTLQRYSVCGGSFCSSSDATEGTYLTLNWQSGVVEGGSSGSAAFVTLGERRYVVGQLLGGSSSCAVPTGVDHYGRFDLSYREAIKNWLNPGA